MENLNSSDPWWVGFNDGYKNREYNNKYSTVTSKNEYQQGYDTGYELQPLHFGYTGVFK